jgi:hypothetical protein
MFQYALGRHLAQRNSSLLKLDISSYELDKSRRYGLFCFNILEHFASVEEINLIKGNNARFSRFSSKIRQKFSFINPPKSDSLWKINCKESRLSFDPAVLKLKGNIYLEGYWQSDKYFSDIRDILLNEFYVKDKINVVKKELEEKICNTNSVSLHLRRGDYVSNHITNLYHGLCSLDYYKKAVDQIVQKISNVHFYIFSDEPVWVKENFKLDYPVTIIDNNSVSSDYEDLRLMSLCHHNIIANSSFSWWGAWLNKNPGKIVYAPQKWFNDRSLDTQDLIPESWIKL